MASYGTESAAPSPTTGSGGPSHEPPMGSESTVSNGGLRATFRSLRHRNYRLYFFGQMVSLVGTWMQPTVVLVLAFELTRQSKWPSLIVAAGVLPTFLLGAWGGSLADRVPKRWLIFSTQSVFTLLAFLLAGLVYFGAVTAWQ